MKKLFLLAALAAVCSVVSAQTRADLGSWVSASLVKSWDKPFVSARLEHRSCANLRVTECFFVAVSGGYNFNGWLKGDIGYEYWNLPNNGHASVHKATAGLTGTIRREGLAVSLREKYEQAFAVGGGASGTLRSRLRAQYKCPSSAFTPYLMYEHFQCFGAQTGWQRSLHYVGTEINLGRGNNLDIFYNYHLFPRGSNICSCHVIGVGYTLVLK